jgi:diguanylate cyclase (GGDEF)-like protein
MTRFWYIGRLSLALAALMLSLLFLAYGIGLIPDAESLSLDSRAGLAKTLGIEAASAVQSDNIKPFEGIVRQVLDSGTDLLSAGLRDAGGDLIADVGGHAEQWKDPGEKSTSTHVWLWVDLNGAPWGRVEFCFKPLPQPALFGLWPGGAVGRLFSFCGATSIFCFGAYLWYVMGRILGQSDESVPQRVRAALDTLAEGVLVLDKKNRIAHANQAFAKLAQSSVEELQTRTVNELSWTRPRGAISADAAMPWDAAARDGITRIGVPLMLNPSELSEHMVSVNATPIVSDTGESRGILATFDDMTEIEKRNTSMQELLHKLKQSRAEIHRQNQELKLLATRDPLTLCLNRRAFFTELNPLYEQSARTGTPLSAVMVDIDKFKKINDQYGHASGDQVLFQVAELLLNRARTTDVICRYGGEEFALILPHTDLETATAVAERLRVALAATPLAGISVTASFGVSALQLGPTGPQSLLDQADKALYHAKRTGRDRVVRYNDIDATADDAPAGSEVVSGIGSGTRIRPVSAIPYPAVAALISALAYRDNMTADHSRRVADLCVTVGRSMLSQSECYALEVAALLHDIGKLGVPDAILFKPGKLTEDEFKIMRLHDRMGVEIISAAFASEALTRIVGSYQTKYGSAEVGSDAPVGASIPLPARLLAIADAFDSMTTDRVWRKGFAREDACAELRRCAGTQFDPDLVERFIGVITAQNVTRDESLTVSKETALRLGALIEHLAGAIDSNDRSALARMAEQIASEARSCELAILADAADRLKEMATTGTEWIEVVTLANEMLELCRSTQSVYLRSARHETAVIHELYSSRTGDILSTPVPATESSQTPLPADNPASSEVDDVESIFSAESANPQPSEASIASRRQFRRPLVLTPE